MPSETVGAGQTSEKVLVNYPVPYKGVMRGRSEVEIPKDALWIGENVHLEDGELRQRPSWNLARNATVAAPPTGYPITGIFSARRAESRDQFLLVGGSVNVYGLSSAAWVLLTTWGATRPNYRQVRFTELAFDTPLVTRVCYVNGVDTPQILAIPASGDFTIANVSTMTGGPIWRDVCTASDRLVGITDTQVAWTANLSVAAPAATSVKSLMETLDLCIAIRPISTLNVAVWKERSIWLGIFSGGGEATAFRWRQLKNVEGPAAPNALVNDSFGNWFWMTKQGRIVKMEAEGYGISFPGDGVWPLIRDQMSLNITEYGLCHAVYRPISDEIWFFYGSIT